MSLDFLVGYTGLWAFGHAAFFGIGAYTTGILYRELGITSFLITAPTSILITVLSACFFGVIALRVSKIYFLLITIAMGQLVFGIFNTSAGTLGAITGGSDGLGGIPYPGLGFSFTPTTYYFFCLIMIWFCPNLTLDRLLYNVLFTIWIYIGSLLEERDLVSLFGKEYREYQDKVPMLIPYSFRQYK